jgi:hypothetical protein
MRHRWPLGGVIFILFPSGLGVYIPMSPCILRLAAFNSARLWWILTALEGEGMRGHKKGARVHPAVPAPPSAGRSALESLQQGHTERSAGPC